MHAQRYAPTISPMQGNIYVPIGKEGDKTSDLNVETGPFNFKANKKDVVTTMWGFHDQFPNGHVVKMVIRTRIG